MKKFIFFVMLVSVAPAQETYDFRSAQRTAVLSQRVYLPGVCTYGDMSQLLNPPSAPAVYVCGYVSDWHLISSTTSVVAHNGNYTVLGADLGSLLTTNTTAAWTLPGCSSTGFPAQSSIQMLNASASSVLTVSTTTSTFYGSGTSGTSFTIPAGSSSSVVCDTGGNWLVNSGGGTSSGGSVTGTGLIAGQVVVGAGSSAVQISPVVVDNTTGNVSTPGTISSGNGTQSPTLILPELTANGANDTRIYGADLQASSGCTVWPVGASTTGQVAADGGTTETTTDGKTCRVFTWQTPSGGGGYITAQGVCPGYPGATGVVGLIGLGGNSATGVCNVAPSAAFGFVVPLSGLHLVGFVIESSQNGYNSSDGAFTVWNSSGSATAATCTIGTATQCSWTGSISVSKFDKLYVQMGAVTGGATGMDGLSAVLVLQ